MAQSPLRGHRPERLSEPLVSHLLERIVSGQLAPGELLLTEPALGELFGVSRTVVREALKSLESRGLISIERGRGTTVCPPDQWSVLDPDVLAAQVRHADSYRVFDDLSRVRIALEPEMAHLAARNATDQDRGTLARLIDQMGAALHDPARYLELDLDFHDAVMTASGNRMAHGILRSVRDALRASRENTNRIPGGLDQAQRFHESIYVAIAEGDAERAALEMRLHVSWSWRRYRQLYTPQGLVGPDSPEEGEFTSGATTKP
jgi:DNA-binding FadR family transcriptional regulator